MPQAGKYALLKVDYSRGAAAGRWEYFDHAWKPYDAAASDVVEKVWAGAGAPRHARVGRSAETGPPRQLFVTYQANPQLGSRCVQSGHWNYLVQLAMRGNRGGGRVFVHP